VSEMQHKTKLSLSLFAVLRKIAKILAFMVLAIPLFIACLIIALGDSG